MNTKVAYNSLNTEFLEKINKFHDHSLWNLKIDFWGNFSKNAKIARNSLIIEFLGK